MTSVKACSNALAATLLLLAFLYLAQSFFIPLFFALLVIALVWPVQAELQRKIPKLLALLVTLMITVIIVGIVASAVLWGFSRLAHWLFLNATRFQSIYVEWTSWLEGHGLVIVGPLADRFDVRWLLGFTQGIAYRLSSVAGFLALMFILVMIGLLEVHDFKGRLSSPQLAPLGHRFLEANSEISAKLRRFMVVRTLASLLTGVIVWAFAAVAGLELAAAWGAIAFALNYIPFLGPLIATAFPTLFAIAQFELWQTALVIFLGLNAIQFIIGSYVEPLLTGASLSLSPFAVIAAVFFWSFMWGMPGAFIGVPILIAAVIYCRVIPGMGWVSAILATKIPDETTVGPSV